MRGRAAAAGCDVFLMWPDKADTVQALIADMKERAAKHGRTLRFGYRAHVIVRDTESEARAAADRLLSKLDAAAGRGHSRQIARYELGRSGGAGSLARERGAGWLR